MTFKCVCICTLTRVCMHATAPGWIKGALGLMPRGGVDMTLLMTFKLRSAIALVLKKKRSVIDFVHAVFNDP